MHTQLKNNKPTSDSIRPSAFLKNTRKNNSAASLQDNRPEHQQQQHWMNIADNSSITAQRKAPSNGLPDTLRTGIEQLSGYSMSDVKVHYGSSKPGSLNAHAYAQGNQIHLATGQEKHLAHEAWHVVQQKQGRVKPSFQLNGTPVNNNTSLEQEADTMGQKALQRKEIQGSKGLKQVNSNDLTVQRVFSFDLGNDKYRPLIKHTIEMVIARSKVLKEIEADKTFTITIRDDQTEIWDNGKFKGVDIGKRSNGETEVVDNHRAVVVLNITHMLANYTNLFKADEKGNIPANNSDTQKKFGTELGHITRVISHELINHAGRAYKTQLKGKPKPYSFEAADHMQLFQLNGIQTENFKDTLNTRMAIVKSYLAHNEFDETLGFMNSWVGELMREAFKDDKAGNSTAITAWKRAVTWKNKGSKSDPQYSNNDNERIELRNKELLDVYGDTMDKKKMYDETIKEIKTQFDEICAEESKTKEKSKKIEEMRKLIIL